MPKINARNEHIRNKISMSALTPQCEVTLSILRPKILVVVTGKAATRKNKNVLYHPQGMRTQYSFGSVISSTFRKVYV